MNQLVPRNQRYDLITWRGGLDALLRRPLTGDAEHAKAEVKDRALTGSTPKKSESSPNRIPIKAR